MGFSLRRMYGWIWRNYMRPWEELRTTMEFFVDLDDIVRAYFILSFKLFQNSLLDLPM
jgi:hypothetical protein